MTRIIKFDASQLADQLRYQWLYSSVVLGSVPEPGEKGIHVTAANVKILDLLDSISDEANLSAERAWPGLSTELNGYNARNMHDGIHKLVVRESELSRMEKMVDAASLRFNPLIQRKHFGGPHGLFEFLHAAERNEDKPK